MANISPRKWHKCKLVSGDRLCGQRFGLTMYWVDRLRTSADTRVLSGRPTVVMVWWAAAGFDWSALTFRFSWTVTLDIHGLGVLRAHLLGLCCTTAFPPIFLQLRKGPLWSCAELLQSCALWCVDQCGTVKPRLLRSANCSGICWEEGMGGWGVLVSEEVDTMKS